MIAARFISIRLSPAFYIQLWKYWPRETRSRLLNAARHAAGGGGSGNPWREPDRGRRERHAKGARIGDSTRVWNRGRLRGDPARPLPGSHGGCYFFHPPPIHRGGGGVDHRRVSSCYPWVTREIPGQTKLPGYPGISRDTRMHEIAETTNLLLLLVLLWCLRYNLHFQRWIMKRNQVFTLN